MRKLFWKFVREEDGVTAIEYGLLAALIALAMAVGAEVTGNGLATIFDGIGTELESATIPAVP